MTAANRTLYSWGPQDPASLYAASLLRGTELAEEPRGRPIASSSASDPASTPTSLVFRAASPILHTVVPCVELNGVPLDAGVDAVRRSVKTSLDDDDERAVPLHMLLDTRLEGLVLHALFIPASNLRKTGPLYVRHLSALHSRSVLSRLRTSVRARLLREGLISSSATSTDATADGDEDEWRRKLDAGRDAEERARRMRAGKSIDEKSKEKLREGFQKSRILGVAKDVLECLAGALGTSEHFFDAPSPGPLDIHLFALLHPLLTCDLPASPLPDLLHSDFPTLVSHTHRLRAYLWPAILDTGDSVDDTQSTVLSSPFIQEEDLHPPTWSSTFQSASEQTRALATDLAFLLPWPLTLLTPSPAPSAAQMGPHSHTSGAASSSAAAAATQRAAQRRLQIGAIIWSVTAVVGTIAYAFGSGLLSISIEDAEIEEEDQGAIDGEVGEDVEEEGDEEEVDEEGVDEEEDDEEWEVEIDVDDEDFDEDDDDDED